MKMLFTLLLLAAVVASSAQSLQPTIIPNGYVNLGRKFKETAFDKSGRLIGILAEDRANKIYRYNIDGTPDASFGNGGVVTIDSVYEYNSFDLYNPMEDDTAHVLGMVTTDNMGRLLVSEFLGYFKWPGGQPEPWSVHRIIRFNSNGTLDNSFGAAGKVNVQEFAPWDPPYFGPIAAQPDNKVVATESVYHSSFFYEYFQVIRLLNDGSAWDFSLWSFDDPRLRVDNIQRFFPMALAVQPDGKIVVELAKDDYNDDSNLKPDSLMLVRLNPDGSFDQSFGDGGLRVYNRMVNRDKWHNLVVQQDGKMVVVTEENTLLQITPDGNIDPQFYQKQFPNFFGLVRLVAGSNDKLYLGGTNYYNDFWITRFDKYGLFDPSFNNWTDLIQDFGSADTVQNMIEVGNKLYVYGTGIYASYTLPVCTPPTFLNNRTIVLDASCGKNDGNISLIPTSGTPPFMYSINGGESYVPGPNGGYTFEGLGAGTYRLRLMDAANCQSYVVEKVIKEVFNCPPVCKPPTFLNNGQIVLDASCNGGDGAIFLVPLSGTPPFQYSINGGTTYVSGPNTGYGFQHLSAGSYQLRLKDANGCESAVATRVVKANAFGNCATLSAMGKRSAVTGPTEASVQLYPNPSPGQFKVMLRGFSGAVQLMITDVQGRVVLQKPVNPAESSVVDVNLSGKAKGVYLVKVVSEKSVQVQKLVVQ